jgi:RNA polymerase sigma-70 factor (ECF subfamily)
MTDELTPDSRDDVLLARIAAGDQAAFTTLFRRRQPDVYRVALLMTGAAANAEDVTQEVFLSVMHDAARYDPARGTAKAWLCGIARNHAKRRLERDGRNLPLPNEMEETAALRAVAADPIAELEQTRRVHALRRAILALPLRYREVVVLCDLEEISYSDAAVVLECAIGTVRSRLHRARTLLAAKVRVHLGPSEAPARKRVPRCLA